MQFVNIAYFLVIILGQLEELKFQLSLGILFVGIYYQEHVRYVSWKEYLKHFEIKYFLIY